MAKLRKDFKENLKWNVQDLYKTEEDYEKDYQFVKEHLKDYGKYQGHLLDNENILYEALSFDNHLFWSEFMFMLILIMIVILQK